MSEEANLTCTVTTHKCKHSHRAPVCAVSHVYLFHIMLKNVQCNPFCSDHIAVFVSQDHKFEHSADHQGI